MQDSNKKILVDQGWEAMELILDVEMPQKKKRRFFILWFFGGLLMLSAALYMYATYVSQPREQVVLTEKNLKKEITPASNSTVPVEDILEKENQSTEVNSKKEISRAQINTTATDEFIVNGGFVSKDKNEKVLDPSNESTLKPANRTSRQLPLPDQFSNSERGLTKNIAGGANKPNLPETKLIGDANQKKSKNQKASTDKENIANEIIAESEKRDLLHLTNVARLQEFDQLEYFYNIVIEPLTDSNKTGFWYASIGGQGSWGPSVDLLGLSGVVDLAYSFNDKIDFGLSFGLGGFKYSSSTKNESIFNASGRTMFSEAEKGNILNSSFLNASSLDLGLHSKLKLSDRIKLRADAGYSYLFTSMFDRGATMQDGLDTGLGVTASPEEMDIIETVDPGEEVVFDLEQKWFPYVGLGISRSINSKIGLNLSYKKVFGELFDQSANPLSLDRIQLGVNYRFFTKPKEF